MRACSTLIKVAFIILLLMNGPPILFGQKKVSKLDADQIIAKFLEKLEQDALHIADNYIHEELEITEQVKNGIVVKHEENLFVVEKTDGILYKKLIVKDGLRIEDTGFEPKKESVLINARLFAKYHLELKGESEFQGQKCWILDFEPRKNLKDEGASILERALDRALNNSVGRVLISQSSRSLVMLRGRLTKELSYGSSYFVGAKLKRADFSLEAFWVDERFAIAKIWVEYEYSTGGLARLFAGSGGHFKKTILYQNYKRRAE